MATKIEEIEGIGPALGEKLRNVGIKSVEDLLAKCGQNAGREAVAAETGISEKLLLDWANMADLMRIDGIGPEFAELLEAAGVDTVKELAQRNAANLTAKLAETHAKKGLTRTVPSEKQVDRWIDEAKGLTPAVSH
jgi:predicted flap endonuclease-1-like 5' DNA nuclease